MIIDTNIDVTAKLAALKAAGVTSIGRYLNRLAPHEEKVVKPAEARIIRAAGLRLWLIYEIGGRPSGAEQGKLDGEWSRAYMPTVGAPAGASIAYTVDYDAPPADEPAIAAAFQAFRAVLTPLYRVNVYGSGAVCSAMIGAGAADAAFLSCAMGWRGSHAFANAGKWALRQHAPTTLCGIDCDVNDASGDFGDFVPFAPVAVPKAAPSGWLSSFLKKLGAA